MKEKKFFIGKIFLIFVLSLFFSNFLINEIFLVKSPRIRPNLFSYLADKYGRFMFIFPSKELELKRNEISSLSILKTNLKPIAPGVRAASLGSVSYIEYNLNKVQWTQIEYILKDGRKIKIKYPRNSLPPPKEIFE